MIQDRFLFVCFLGVFAKAKSVLLCFDCYLAKHAASDCKKAVQNRCLKNSRFLASFLSLNPLSLFLSLSRARAKERKRERESVRVNLVSVCECARARARVCVCVFVYVCIHACVCVCVCVCVAEALFSFLMGYSICIEQKEHWKSI